MYSDGTGQRVLVVDDDAGVRLLLSELLTYEGYTVVEAGDGLEALQELKKRPVDVVISDYHMPKFDGLQLLAICRIVWPETAVIIVSGEHSNWMERASRDGAQAWIKKPWERTHLLMEVRLATQKMSGGPVTQPM